MFCANCGIPLTQGLSYCNRCGTSLREPPEASTGTISAYLTAITLIGIFGLLIMLGGAVLLRKEANLAQSLIGFFMLFTFLFVSVTELSLIKSLANLTGVTDRKKRVPAQVAMPMQNDLRLPQGSPLGEPVSSVTENTTRTLEYARREHQV
jgi:hypothetical protein